MRKKITSQLLALDIGEQATFPRSKYELINASICQPLARRKMYFSMRSVNDTEIIVTRIGHKDKVKVKATIQAMKIGETMLESPERYPALHVTVTRLHKAGMGEWTMVKTKEMVSIKREA